MGSFRSFFAVFSQLAASSAPFFACGVISSSLLDCSIIDYRFILQLSFDLLFDSALFYC